MGELTIKYNELTAEEFITLWESVWGDGPTVTQTELAMGHTLFRVSVYDGENVVAMARMIGDMGLNYYINNNGVKGTNIFVELCAVPDKVPFYEKYGFSANEAQRLKLTHKVY